MLNQYNELKDALESLALDTFSIDDFFPKKGQDYDLLNGLAGLSGIFSILGGFVPGVGFALSIAGTIASSVGTFLSNSVAAAEDSLKAQKTFAGKVKALYKELLRGMDDVVTKLFQGEQIGGSQGSFNIIDMMRGGVWVDSKVVTKVSDLNAKIRIEVLSRSINALWKTPTGNKMWVHFVDFQDLNGQKCQADTSGSPDSKYCVDGGVYYTYNFVEGKGGGSGAVGYPWGGQNLKQLDISLQVRGLHHEIEEFGLTLSVQWVTEAFAKSYRLMKATSQDLFNFDHIAGTRSFLEEAFRQNNESVDITQLAGRYSGSWTLPVCDSSTWGKSWNWNYVEDNSLRARGLIGELLGSRSDTHSPCLCGKLGKS